jgi:hypothetical protein
LGDDKPRIQQLNIILNQSLVPGQCLLEIPLLATELLYAY